MTIYKISQMSMKQQVKRSVFEMNIVDTMIEIAQLKSWSKYTFTAKQSAFYKAHI